MITFLHFLRSDMVSENAKKPGENDFLHYWISCGSRARSREKRDSRVEQQ